MNKYDLREVKRIYNDVALEGVVLKIGSFLFILMGFYFFLTIDFFMGIFGIIFGLLFYDFSDEKRRLRWCFQK